MLDRGHFRCFGIVLALTIGSGTLAHSEQTFSDTPKPASLMPLAQKAVFLDLAKSGGRLIAVGERGIIVFSDDEGKTWTQARVPLRATLTAVTFVTDQKGIAVGHDASIIHTEDGGSTWSIVQFDPDSQNVLLNVRFRSKTHGYITGTNGQLLLTDDGGSTWRAQTLAVEEWYQNHLFDIAWTEEAVVVVAEKGVLYRTTSGKVPGNQTSRGETPEGEALEGEALESEALESGGHWNSVPSPYEGSYFGAIVSPDGSLVIYGMSGRIYRSSDSGLTWERVSTTTQQFLFDAATLPDGRLLIVGAGGTMCMVAASRDDAQCRQRGARVGFTSVMVDQDRIYLGLSNGGISTVTLGDLEGN